jgi:hypothetical protein
MAVRPKVLFAAGALASALLATGAWAADEVTDAIQAAYAPYRTALFRTNSKAQAESEQAIVNTRRSWQAIIDRYAARPPVPYDRDADFAPTLAKVAAVYEQAEREIRQQQLPQAHETLEAARDLMAALRQRNGVIVYSDHMNAYHAEMEQVLTEGPKLLAAPQGVLQLLPAVGVLDYLARRLRSEATPALQRDPEFIASVQAVEASVAALRAAALSQDAAAVKQALAALKGPYSRMFLKFG